MRVTSFAAALILIATASAGCAAGVPSYRSLHYVDGELVYSRPISSAGYAAYLKARVALEAEPPQIEVAEAYIDRALRYDSRDPHLWTTRAEISAKAGDDASAMASASRALELRPGYPPARSLMAKLSGGPASAAVETGL